MKEECLICKAPLEYLLEDVEMECAICHRIERSKTRCVNGHYVCSECHTAGIDSIFGVCLSETSKDPVEILNELMKLPFCHMHGPEHHIMVGAALLTAYHRCLRFLGCLRCRNQCGNFRLHHLRINAPYCKILRSLQPYDRTVTGGNRHSGWSPLLQTRFLSLYPRGS